MRKKNKESYINLTSFTDKILLCETIPTTNLWVFNMVS